MTYISDQRLGKAFLLQRSNKAVGTTHPENLSADVCNPVFLETVPFCLLHQVSDRARTTVLHHQLQEDERNTPLPQRWHGTSTETMCKHPLYHNQGGANYTQASRMPSDTKSHFLNHTHWLNK